MYQRIFTPFRHSKTHYFTLFVIVVNILLYLSVLTIAITGCIPRHKIWQRWVPGRCVNGMVVLIFSNVINSLSDFAILLLPIGCIWRLQLPLRRKLAISAVFATGLV